MNWRDGYIAVDWGTTNRRAYRVDDGRLTREYDDELGVTAIAPGGFDAAVAGLRAELGDLPMLLAGMIGSDRGWREAGYVPCPADLDALAGAILWVDAATGIVPGLCQRDPADVMRGEEVQILGAMAAGLAGGDGIVCHPGTHAKWIMTAGGAIAGFRTMMTGEMFALLSQHSILADRLTAEVSPGVAFSAGVAEAQAGGDLLSGLFRIRARHLLGEGGSDDAAFASGLLIGSDVAAGLRLAGDGPVTLIGRADLCALYASAVEACGRRTTRVDGATAFLAGIAQLVQRL